MAGLSPKSRASKSADVLVVAVSLKFIKIIGILAVPVDGITFRWALVITGSFSIISREGRKNL